MRLALSEIDDECSWVSIWQLSYPSSGWSLDREIYVYKVVRESNKEVWGIIDMK